MFLCSVSRAFSFAKLYGLVRNLFHYNEWGGYDSYAVLKYGGSTCDLLCVISTNREQLSGSWYIRDLKLYIHINSRPTYFFRRCVQQTRRM
jgi:hypothetical protein